MAQTTAKKPAYLVPVMIVGLGLLALGGYSLEEHVRFETVAVHAKGTVVNTNTEYRRGRRGSVAIVRPVVKFQPEDAKEPITAVAKVASSSGDYGSGQEIEIEYDPHQPASTVRVDSGVPFADIGTTVLGLGLVGAGLSGRRDRRKKG